MQVLSRRKREETTIHTPNFVTMTTEIRSLVNAAIFEHFDGDEDSDDALDSSELFDYDADSAAAVAGAVGAAVVGACVGIFVGVIVVGTAAS